MNRPEPTRKAEIAAAEPTSTELRTAARERRARLEENCETVLEAIRVPNADGSGKTLAQIRAAVKGMTDEHFQAALDALPPDFVERSVNASLGALVWHARPVPSTKRIVIPEE